MSNSVTTYVPFPPANTQITTGSGTLLSAGVISPLAAGVATSNLYECDCTVYNSATGALDLTTPLVTIKGKQTSGPISLAFTKGLYVVQRSPSSITVNWQ